MTQISPQEFGRLVGAVEVLSKQVAHMAQELDTITNQLNQGKGAIIGIVFASGGLGAGVATALGKVFA